MYSLHTLSWYWKALIVAYDMLKCFLQQRKDASAPTDSELHTTVVVFAVQLLLWLVLVAPSVCFSVSSRLQTNTFLSEMVLLLSIYLLLVREMLKRSVSVEHVCFCLQFCSCFFWYCHLHAVLQNRKLLLASKVVKVVSVLAMCVFPVLFSHVLPDCMHLSPYVLIFVFSGEISGCACTAATQTLAAVEFCMGAAYVKLADSM